MTHAPVSLVMEGAGELVMNPASAHSFCYERWPVFYIRQARLTLAAHTSRSTSDKRRTP